MLNYFIIGGDGKEYGPITEGNIRQWLAEGRLNAQTSARTDADVNWRPLGTFAEFADIFQTPPTIAAPPSSTGPAGFEDDSDKKFALQEVKGPAIALKVTAIINFGLSLFGLLRLIFFRSAVEEEYTREFAKYPQLQDAGMQQMFKMIYGPIGIASNLLTLVVAILIFWGAAKMQQLKFIEMAWVAAILSMIPCVSACCLIGLPFGIWAIVVLRKEAVKSQFK